MAACASPRLLQVRFCGTPSSSLTRRLSCQTVGLRLSYVAWLSLFCFFGSLAEEDASPPRSASAQAYLEAAEQRRLARQKKREHLASHKQANSSVNFSSDRYWKTFWRLQASGSLGNTSASDSRPTGNEWYGFGMPDVRSWLIGVLDERSRARKVPRDKLRVLHLGCGLSDLAEGLLDEGFRDLTHVDISKAAVESLRRRVGEEGGSFLVADARNLSTILDHSYDAAVEKGLLDALLGADEPLAPVLSEAHRVLASHGMLVSISSNVRQLGPEKILELGWGSRLSDALEVKFSDVQRRELPRGGDALLEAIARGEVLYPQPPPVFGYIARSAAGTPRTSPDEL